MMTDRPGPILDLALGLPARLFGALASFRGYLYDSGTLEIVDAGSPVISIGNLTAGGTGKTPITSFLASYLSKRELACAIVSRGYGASVEGPALVPINGNAAEFGDEPTWLAAEHPDVTVVIGAKRPEAIAFLKSGRGEDLAEKFIVLADDGFQHRRLKRNLDLVILDATEPRWHYRSLPQGRMRESFDALKRASFIFISKTNLAEASQLAWLRDQARAYGKPVIEFAVGLNGFVPLDRNLPNAIPRPLSVGRVVLVSGIARPETFEQLITESIAGVQVLKHFIFKDHHAFSVSDFESIEVQALELGAEAIVVTEKDATKLRQWHPELPCYVSRLVAKPLTDLGGFHEAIDRLV
jgi:tetraacyldisaccharide 4'-kinase